MIKIRKIRTKNKYEQFLGKITSRVIHEAKIAIFWSRWTGY
jgi:hypothetical protein